MSTLAILDDSIHTKTLIQPLQYNLLIGADMSITKSAELTLVIMDAAEFTSLPTSPWLAWDASSRYLATGGSDSVVVWDCSGKGPEGCKPATLQSHEDLISCLAFQPVGDILASGGRDGNLMLWRGMKNKKSRCLQQSWKSLSVKSRGHPMASSSPQAPRRVMCFCLK